MDYRKGAIGALLDIYEHEINLLMEMLENNFTLIKDSSDDWSIKKILSHVLRAGFYYTKDIRDTWGGDNLEHRDKFEFESVKEFIPLVKEMLHYMDLSLSDKTDYSPEYFKITVKTSWGQIYDLEQIIEHAIVHVQRHNRQIRRLYLK